MLGARRCCPGGLAGGEDGFGNGRRDQAFQVNLETGESAMPATSGIEPLAPQQSHQAGGHHQGLLKLAVGAVGVVFGDIGTSPLYAFRETFAGHHRLIPNELNVLGVLSLIFWSMMIVVTLKYVIIIMRADNKGEGGSLALLALISRSTNSTKRWTGGLVLLGVFATALFYGDSMITPAISVLSAVEGPPWWRAGSRRSCCRSRSAS
jgi:KUP system potassium uptake protein